jgi:hypothetical protein
VRRAKTDAAVNALDVLSRLVSVLS